MQALQRPREAAAQFVSHELPFRCGLGKIDKTGKMNRLLLSPVMGLNRGSLQEFVSVLRGEPQGGDARSWFACKVCPAVGVDGSKCWDLHQIFFSSPLPLAAKYCQYFTLRSLLMARKSADCFKMVAMESTRISWVILACLALGFSARNTYWDKRAGSG